MASGKITVSEIRRVTVFDQRGGAQEMFRIEFSAEGIGDHFVDVPVADFRSEVAVAAVRKLVEELKRVKDTFQ